MGVDGQAAVSARPDAMQIDDPATLQPTRAVSPGATTAWPYADGRSHLADELRLLDMRITSLLNVPPRELAGLTVSEREIDELMDRPGPLRALPLVAEDCTALDDAIVRASRASAAAGRFLPLPELALRCGLSRLEERVLVACLAPEIDSKYDKVFGYLHDDITRRRPTAGLALRLSCDGRIDTLASRAVFAADAPLLRFGLVSIGEACEPLIARPLKLADRIVDHLLEVPRHDARLAPRRSFEGLAVPAAVVSRLRAFLQRHAVPDYPAGMNVLFHLHGPRGTPSRALAEAVCDELGLPLLVVDLDDWLAQPEHFDEALHELCREALLLDAGLCFEHANGLFTDEGQRLRRLLQATEGRPVFLTASVPWQARLGLGPRLLAEIVIPPPDLALRRQAWERALHGTPAGAGIDLTALAAKFRFTTGQIEAAANKSASRAGWESPEDERIGSASLHLACRIQSTPQLGSLARRIAPQRGWHDLVLPPDEMRQLREFCERARLRDVVYGQWGFDRKLQLGKGLNALFCGNPGAGKTLAAEVAAADLGLDLYKIDLSQVVSKFIGETEKQLRQVFDEAQGSEVVLFFDEADALFGKRSEVKDAHDRYANIEIGYLLQRMEEYDGIAIMATNMRSSIDDAFVRRLQLILEFPFPQEAERARIWRAHLPPELPLDPDLDFDFLAASLTLSGGYIRNVVVAAAFQAAAEGKPLAMRHALRAVRREFQKMGRNCAPAEFGRYGHLLHQEAT